MDKARDISKKTEINELKVSYNVNSSPQAPGSLDRFRAKYGKYAVSVIELRKTIDKEMGRRTLTAELYAMREES